MFGARKQIARIDAANAATAEKVARAQQLPPPPPKRPPTEPQPCIQETYSFRIPAAHRR